MIPGLPHRNQGITGQMTVGHRGPTAGPTGMPTSMMDAR